MATIPASSTLSSSNVPSAGTVAHARKLSAFSSKPLPSTPALTPEQLSIQSVPRDAAMLELLPRGDVFAAHKLATSGGETEELLPQHVQEKLALFEQSFSVLKFPYKTYNAVLLDQPSFKETFHTDTVVTPTTAAAAGAPVHALMRSQKSLDLHPVEDGPSKLKAATVSVAEVFEGMEAEVGGRSRSTGDRASNPPLPEGYAGKEAPKEGGLKTVQEESPAKSSAAPPPPAEPAAVVLRSYFPSWDWGNGAETALCERVPLPVPTRACGPATRFLLHAKSLQFAMAMPPAGREIEPFFCELAVYNVHPDSRSKLTDSFHVQLSNMQLVKMLDASRVAKAASGGGGPKGRNEVPQPSPFVPLGYMNASASSPCTRGLFALPQNIPNKSGTVMVVLLVYKILQGKLDCLDIYTKGHEVKEKDLKSAEQKATEAARRWGDHRQLAFWNAAPLFNDAGGLNQLDFKELYRQPKPEEGFTCTTLCDAAFSLLQGKKKNSAGFKAVPGAFLCSVIPMPSSRAAAIVEAERIAPVYNSNLVPVRMEPVVESSESLCVGHEVLSNQGPAIQGGPAPPSGATSPEAVAISDKVTKNRAGSISHPGSSTTPASSLVTPPRQQKSASVIVPGSTGGKGGHARDKSLHALLDKSLHLAEDSSNQDPFAASPNRGGAGADSATGVLSEEQQKRMDRLRQSPIQSAHASEVSSTVSAEEWVEVDQQGLLVRKSSTQPHLSVSVTAPEGSTSPASAGVTSPSSPIPLSPTSRALIKLDHGRQRSYVLPPSGEGMSHTGFIQEIDMVEDLAIQSASAGSTNLPSPTHAACAPGVLTRDSSGSGSSTTSSPSSGMQTLSAPTSAAEKAAKLALEAAAEDIASPFHLHYTNQLFVYPQSITFSDARNVVVGIQIKDTHESSSEPGLELIYPRSDELLNGVNFSGNPRLGAGKTLGSFVSQTFTSATYHSYDAKFIDEIKIELPLILKPSHHLLFSFYNISCKSEVIPSKDGSGDDRTLLGYSMLPLYLDQRIVDEGYTLPVYTKLKPHYMLQKDEWDNRRTSLFEVRLRVNSSLYTNDPFLNKFFLACGIPKEITHANNNEKNGNSPPGAAGGNEEDSAATPQKRKSATDTKDTSSDSMLSLMLRKVLRSGQLRKKGGLKWTDRWWALTDSSLIVYKNHKESKPWHFQPVSSRTLTQRSGGAKQDDELRYAWTIRADGVPPSTEIVSIAEAEPSPSSASSAQNTGVTSPTPAGNVAGSPTPVPSATTAATASGAGGLTSPSPSPSGEDVLSPASSVGQAPTSTSASVSTVPATPSVSTTPAGVQSPPPVARPNAPASAAKSPTPSTTVMGGGASGVVFIPGLDPEMFENEMSLFAETEDEMFSWLKAIAHAKIAKWTIVESIRGVREAQGELLIKHLPAIMRQLLSVICCPDALAPDVDAIVGTGQGGLEKLKLTAFETLLEVSSLVEQGTNATGDKQRNVHLDSWCQFIFDDNSSALPIGGTGANRSNGSVSGPGGAGAPGGPSTAPSNPFEGGAAGGLNVPGNANPNAPAIPARPVAPKSQRVRSYEALATFWLGLMKGGGASGSSAGSGGSQSMQTGAMGGGSLGGSTSRSLPPLREHAARFSWLLLDMITKSLLLSTAGHRERRVSMSLNSPFGATVSPRPSISGGGSNFFQPKSIKLLTDLVQHLTQEIFFLSNISLSLSKTLNKNLGLFLRDSFYIFPRQVVFDWISVYLMTSFKLEPTRSGGGGGGDGLAGRIQSSSISSGSSSSGASSSRFKYTLLQIVCDHEHYVAYNSRIAPFVGESKKYLQSSEFGDFSMQDFLNQPPRAGVAEGDVNSSPKDSPKLDSVPIEHAKNASISLSASLDDLQLDQLSPMRAEQARGSPQPGASPSSVRPTRSGSTASISGLNLSPPSGHFLPFVLIKQVWLAFRMGAPSSPASGSSSINGTASTSPMSIAQEQALAQASYTLRSVLLKHELDARYQGAKKRSLVAAMYVRILPCLWNNLDRLREMKLSLPGMTNPLEKDPSKQPRLPSNNARKDLVACCLFVLNNLGTQELLKYLRESDYRIHPLNISTWFHKFIDLLQVILETSEYTGPLMRRLEALTNAGGVVSQLVTTLCARMLQSSASVSAAAGGGGGGGEAITDWGQAEEIGTGRVGGAGGLSALESKYTRNRTNTQLQGHRKSIATSGTGTLKRRDVQLSSNMGAAERARSRMANRTLNSKTGALLDGSDAQFAAITGIDPSIQKWEKLYHHESASIVLNILVQVLLPISQETFVKDTHMQDRCLWFLHGFLKLNQSDQILVQWFSLLSTLLEKHSSLIWPLSSKEQDGRRCSEWWYELLRHLSFHSLETRNAASNFIYQLFLSVHHASGSTTRIQTPLIKAFARVMDSLRNRRSEDGQSTYTDPSLNGWTILQSEAKGKDQTNDAAYIGVLSALSKSALSIVHRSEQDPLRNQLDKISCIQDIQQSFQLLQKIIDTSAVIHSIKASTLDPDYLIEHCHSMLRHYKRATRVKLLYWKHLYDLHMAQSNLAEAGAVQLKMFRVIYKQSSKITSQGRVNQSAALWNSDHACCCLKKASELFEQAELYEQALHCENHSIAHWVARKNPAQVVPHAKRLVHLWEKLSSLATLGDTRSFGTFYRVGMYGQAFGSLDGKEFVYREPNLTQLMTISSRLVGMWTNILGREVTLFKDSGAITPELRASLGDACKLQITAVLPFFEEDISQRPPPPPFQSLVHPPTVPELTAAHLTSRETHFERNTAIRRFFYDTPYTLGGKSHGTVETQFKKRSLISLQPNDSFPSFLRRLPVASRTEIDMTPLQNVLEDVRKRVHKLESEARPALGNPDLKTLTQVLSGSVNVQVNGGPAEICQVFLAPANREKWPANELDQLRTALGTFVKAAGEALRVAERLTKDSNENSAFIEVLQKGYTSLIAAVRAAAPDVELD